MGRSGFHKPLRSIIGILIDDLQVWYNAGTGLSFMNDANINRIFDNAVDRGVGKIFPVRFENPLLCQIAAEPLSSISLIDIYMVLA